MSEPIPNTTDRDELRDRLVDRALAEKLGGETPPDLSAAILARAAVASDPVSTPTEAAMNGATEQMKRRRNWAPWAIAATLLLVAAGLILPAMQSVRELGARFSRDDAVKPAEAAQAAGRPTAGQGKELEVDNLSESAAGPVETEGWSETEKTNSSSGLSRGISPSQRAPGDEQEASSPQGTTLASVPSADSSGGAKAGRATSRQDGFGLRGRLADGVVVNGSAAAPHDNFAKSAHAYSESESLHVVVQDGEGSKAGEIAKAALGKLAQYSANQDSRYAIVPPPSASAAPGGGTTGADSLMMMTTPHIIIEDEVEERLSVKGEGQQEGHPSPTDPLGWRKSIGQRALSTEASGPQSTLAASSQADGAANADYYNAERSGGGQQAGESAADIAFGATTEEYAAIPGPPVAAARALAGNGAMHFWQAVPEPEAKFADDGHGVGPQAGGDKYARIEENPFKSINPATTDNRLSTFSIDVDTASYANVRQFLLGSRTLPPPDAVRIEELVNYFDYGYSAPTGDVPFASNVEVAACPWKPEHRLVRVGIKGREMDRAKRPKSNLVFLIDVSGSMDEPAKLPLLVEGMKLLSRELGENDRVAIVVYASTEGLVLQSTRGTEQAVILDALNRLSAGGSTAGGAGIQLAYKIAEENFIKDGVNRIVLCTDGDFNVGVTSPAELERMAETNAKETGVFLTVLGFGRGNLNDAMMEQIADKGNGNYHYVDTRAEAKKVLVEEMVGTLVTIAKDVKIQIEFNPAKVASYRLIGYENRVMAAEDFNDDKKDAGEIGAGHTVTALYEVVPVGLDVDAARFDELKYLPPKFDYDGLSRAPQSEDAVITELPSDELLTLKIRYKAPDGDVSEKLEFPINDNEQQFAKASEDFKFASAVASFGMLLRGSEHKGNATYAAVAEIAAAAANAGDKHGYRAEFVEMVKAAKELAGE